MKRLIVSADDFGLTESVNEAVVIAHRNGLLTSTSLMVSAPAAKDAVHRAKDLPALAVGLHLTLVEGTATLPPTEIPDLVGADGQFSGNQVALGFKYFFHPRIRRQLAKEIRAQFASFAATGLPLDHMNAHKHMHLHPTVARLAIQIGKEFGLAAIRVPKEIGSKPFGGKLLSLWTGILRWQARRANITVNDAVFGLRDSGHMNETVFLRCLAELPDGVTEIYFHPALFKDPAFASTMPDYDHEGEFQALLSQRARHFIDINDIKLTTYSTIARS